MHYLEPPYAHTIGTLRALIRKQYRHIGPRNFNVDEIDIREVVLDDVSSPVTARFRLCQYTLWMLDEIEKMQNIRKADRWMGWCLRNMELMGMLTNGESRELVRVDKDNSRA